MNRKIPRAVSQVERIRVEMMVIVVEMTPAVDAVLATLEVMEARTMTVDEISIKCPICCKPQACIRSTRLAKARAL